jgi:hypothetical protein
MKWGGLLVLLCLEAAAQAPTTMRLEHTSDAAACPDAAALTRLVAERLGRDPFTGDAPKKLVVRFGGQPGAFRADLKVIDETGAAKGQRTLQSAAGDCRELAGSVALAMALIIDPLLVLRPPGSPPAPPELQPPPPAPTYPADLQPPPPAPTTPAGQDLTVPPPPPIAGETTRPPPPPPPPGTPPAVQLNLGVGLMGTFFQVPTPSIALGVWADAEGQRWAAGLRGSVTAPAGTAVGVGSVMMMIADVSPYGCLKWGPFGTCGLVRLGFQLGWASGISSSENGSAPEAAIGLEPFFDVNLSELLKLRIHAGAQLNLALASLTVAGFEVYRTPAGTFWLGIDLGFRVPGR